MLKKNLKSIMVAYLAETYGTQENRKKNDELRLKENVAKAKEELEHRKTYETDRVKVLRKQIEKRESVTSYDDLERESLKIEIDRINRAIEAKFKAMDEANGKDLVKSLIEGSDKIETLMFNRVRVNNKDLTLNPIKPLIAERDSYQSRLDAMVVDKELEAMREQYAAQLKSIGTIDAMLAELNELGAHDFDK